MAFDFTRQGALTSFAIFFPSYSNLFKNFKCLFILVDSVRDDAPDKRDELEDDRILEVFSERSCSSWIVLSTDSKFRLRSNLSTTLPKLSG